MRWMTAPAMLLPLAALVLGPDPTARAAPADPPDAAAIRAALQRLDASTPPAVMTDRPIYRPGETIWFRTWRWDGRVTLIDARGQPVAEGARDSADAVAGHLDIPASAGAGRYRLRVGPIERPIVIEQTRRPPLRFTLRYARASHRPGEPVAAAIEVKRPDGTPLAERAVEATVEAGRGVPLTLTGRTDAKGRLTLNFDLPDADGPARLNLRVEGEGSMVGFTRPIPLTPARPTVDILPEGGDAVVGLPGRVYLAARRAAGRPADVSGRILDDRDALIAEIRSVIDGRARFAWTPEAGRRYRLVLDGGGEIPLPAPRDAGCTLRAVDDFDDARPTIGLDLRCAAERPLMVIASRDGIPQAVAETRAGPAADTRVELRTPRRRGPLTLTVLDRDGTPLAERVVFRHRDRGLAITVEADRSRAAPGETVVFTVKAADADGAAVEGDLALAVVDDAALDHADDQSPDVVAQMLLMPVVRGHLERAGRYLAPGADAGRALDLLMGTAGYRRFESLFPVMRPDADHDGIPDVFDQCPTEPEQIDGVADTDGCPDDFEGPRPPAPGLPPTYRLRQGVRIRPPAPDPPPRGPQRVVITTSRIEVRERVYFRTDAAEILPISYPVIEAVADVMLRNPHLRRVEVAGHTDSAGRAAVNLRLSQARAEAVRRFLIERGVQPERLVAVGYGEERPIMHNRTADGRAHNRRVEFTLLDVGHDAPRRVVRRFPAPPPPTAARDDFRETLAWVPRLRWKDGVATVAVRLSDASTAFRAIAAGTGAGAVGRGEAVVTARTPVMLDLDAPARIVAGDRLEAPITVTNHTDRAVAPHIRWSSPLGQGQRTLAELPPGARAALALPLVADGVSPTRGRLAVELTAGMHSDRIERPLGIVGRGFPHSVFRSGRLEPDRQTSFEIVPSTDARALEGELVIAGSMFASLRAAAEAMVVEPSGCFEQTTSKHWPNGMALRLFERAPGAIDPALIARARRYVDAGNRRLATFQGPAGGFGMYGGRSGTPWLTAYGIVQLHETGGDPAVIARAVRWLADNREPTVRAPRRAAVAAWIEWALAIGGRLDRFPPLDDAARTDPYIVAVRVLATVAAGRAADAQTRADAQALAEALAAMADKDGRWTTAKASITGSRGPGLITETTGLAVRALAALDRAPAAREQAIAALQADRRGGVWYTTQATVQALAGILTGHRIDDRPPTGDVIVRANGREIWRHPAASLGQAPHRIPLAEHLGAGATTIELSQSAGALLRWTAVARWTAETVPPAEPPLLRIETALDRATLDSGAAATLTATVSAPIAAVSDPLVRVGLPAGLEPDREQLRAWTEQGRVALAEVRPGEVVLYLDRLDVGATVDLPLTVTARRRGVFRGRPSSAYPYYIPDPAWAPGIEARVR